MEADSRCHLSAGFVVNPRAYHVFAATWAEACARRRLDARTQLDPRINERDRCTILFVDDDVAVRRVARRGLERRGYRVLLACNAVEALKLLLVNRGRIDVVVSDVAIPLVGLATRFLLTTARAGDTVVAALLARDGAALLAKPWTLADLEAGIRGVLEQGAGLDLDE